jgi:hypothetical protein
MITESELRERLIARVETSTTIKPQDLPMARNVATLLVHMVLKIIQEEVKAARPKSGKEE